MIGAALRAITPCRRSRSTAYARPEDHVRSILAGFQMHTTKPVEPEELITMIASLAGRKTM